ncbi:MAG TPA: hypothetical protein VGY98_10420 [Verrucomicrobiae bacterium]|nr:hypothetical protein [Verrucomicrobiae bacterium]
MNSQMPVNDDPRNFYGGEVFIRPGLYLITQTIQTPTNSINGTPKARTWTNYTISDSPYSVIGPNPNAHAADIRTGNLNFPVNAPAFNGSGSGLTFTNAGAASFQVIVNAATNGFDFVPQ